jgi:hypothetical protein
VSPQPQPSCCADKQAVAEPSTGQERNTVTDANCFASADVVSPVVVYGRVRSDGIGLDGFVIIP